MRLPAPFRNPRTTHGRLRLRPAILAVVVVIGVATSACTPAVPPVSDRFSAATHDWWSYTRPATYDVVQSQVTVPMRDGTPIGCTLDRPARDEKPAPGRFPGLIVEFTPYVILGNFYDAEAQFFVRRGYATLVCTVRGIGRSGGTWQHAMAQQDGLDAHDLVEWLATQPFSDGRIGQFGESYGGATTYAAAIERPPHLVAIAPLQSPESLYDDVIYPGGIKATEGGTIDNWPPIGALTSVGGIDAAAEFAINRQHPTFDDYWQSRSFAGRQQLIQVPVLAVGGWQDGYFRSGMLANIEAVPDRTWAIYGPWPHIFPVNLLGGPCFICAPSPLPSGVLLAWFDHWIKRLPDARIPAHPTFVSNEGGTGDGTGWHEIDWKPSGAQAVELQLGADGELAGAASQGSVAFDEPRDPAQPRGSASFTSAALKTAQVLEGHPTLAMRATLDDPDANFYAQLIDVAPDGTETVVNDGFLKASHRTSHVDPTPVTPGQAVDYTIAIRANDYRFAAGHRVRLRVSGGAADTLTPANPPVTVTIATGASTTLRLPGFTTVP